ncbi:hypothetical protein [Halarcobacter anaerophilus]|jgi:hypothetical protein|uniref:DUF3859 domain-containing protein n=1 Tax=Halarcobacter anaerophilus TaxID=877500 RepID=A0A4Q0XZN8_9BACT|nr:hypothetical protein [Halarcobacter anaerophilus]QDF29820.1 hypothetical protein AANAER_2363 [Halarcobacter anaerophilus]RXJ62783.1 hypothetical protein CRV06_08085 [Halarcobacter anaerophilus]
MKKLLSSLLLVSTMSFCETFDEAPLYSADCLILQDENSIICKYEHERLEEDIKITVKWIDPNGEISRQRDIVIPAGHGSVYDFRYIEGREKGIWKFKVTEGDIETETSFSIE